MIKIQVYQIVAEENSNGELPAKAVKVLYLADRLCTLQEIGWVGTTVCSEEAVGVSLEARKRVVKGVQTEVPTAKILYGVTL